MSALHGSWIILQENSYFFLWGETWRAMGWVESESSVFHPFNMNCQELLAFLQSRHLSPEELFNIKQSNLSPEDWWQTEVISLPSHRIDSGELIPILSAQTLQTTNSTNKLNLYSWQVEGLRLPPKEAVKFLQALPLGSFASNYLGDDLRFWSFIYRWSLDLLARGKFLPGISQENGTTISCWQPLLDSAIDQARLSKFTALMPRACCAYQHLQTAQKEPEELLLGSLRITLDAQLRIWLKNNSETHQTAVQKWLNSLALETNNFVAAPKDINYLTIALNNWTLPVQDYLVTSSNTLASIQFRTCFLLQPPSSGNVSWGYVNWKLQYYLQALDDPEFLIDAQTIWQNPVEELVLKGRTIEKPQETLLKGLGFAARIYAPIENSLQEKYPLHCELDPIAVYQFIRASAWQLQNNGLSVILPPGLAEGKGEKRLGIKINAQVNPQKKSERLGLNSLLNYELKLALGDKIISKKDFERMLAQKSPIVEINGEWIALQPADVRAAQAVLEQSNEQLNLSVEDALRLSTGETKTIAKLPVVSFEAAGILQELISNLNHNQGLEPMEKPRDFRGELRPYQARGVSWLSFLERWGLGACLADDMGLGKTIQLIAFMLNLKEQNPLQNPTLLVCPTSVLNNWEREVQKFAPTLKVLIHHGDKRSKGKDFVQAVKKQDLLITSYALVYRDEQTLEQIKWEGIVIDEAQNIKNPLAKQSQVIRKLKSGFRIALTGTPVENRLSELWSILDFLNPGFLGSRQFFQKRFAIPIEKYGDRESLITLRSLVQPFILRRLKTDKNIIQDLPEKQEMTVYCGLSAEQAQMYPRLVDESLKEIDAAAGIKRRGLILTLLLQLKQLCNHPAQYLKEKSLDSGERSGKLLRLEEMLEEVINNNTDKALIFTQFAEWGKLLQPYLAKKLGVETMFLSGATTREKRVEMVDRFQNDPTGPPIFILSLKAGGTGLNLTRANHVFHVDRWWNPAVENQATDRAFRIGQQRNVQVHKFVCTGTLEERISDMLETKQQLAEQTVDAGENWLTELDTEQLRNLLLLDREKIIDSSIN
ncbi:MAG: DEAD/DEAH box helicase [Gomphosphaeria aponina SAG 52.96 = DSM 107014]|uniref:DEAD/DEAH box helicase n=1 Tax=Gomphosphaeria aponina SAG 52.96 = DSM 107014 TaxID=1521640 RepID=A0A941JRG8_9CHRO|nr:DEAD/DEAH box helicase [Gomphosphaeria aponina SAG 52.96 = DSM 107014]